MSTYTFFHARSSGFKACPKPVRWHGFMGGKGNHNMFRQFPCLFWILLSNQVFWDPITWMAVHTFSITNDSLELKHARIDVKLKTIVFRNGISKTRGSFIEIVWFDCFFSKERYEIQRTKKVTAPTNSFQESCWQECGFWFARQNIGTSFPERLF